MAMLVAPSAELVFNKRQVASGYSFGDKSVCTSRNLTCGSVGIYYPMKDALIVRVGPEKHEEALARPHTKPFDITGRPMKGWGMVTPGGYESDEALEDWVQQGLDFALSLPAK
jgi:hypothetical protein